MHQSLTNNYEVLNSSYLSLRYLVAKDNSVLSAQLAMLNVDSPFHQADFTSAIDSDTKLPSAGSSWNPDGVNVSREELL